MANTNLNFCLELKMDEELRKSSGKLFRVLIALLRIN